MSLNVACSVCGKRRKALLRKPKPTQTRSASAPRERQSKHNTEQDSAPLLSRLDPDIGDNNQPDDDGVGDPETNEIPDFADLSSDDDDGLPATATKTRKVRKHEYSSEFVQADVPCSKQCVSVGAQHRHIDYVKKSIDDCGYEKGALSKSTHWQKCIDGAKVDGAVNCIWVDGGLVRQPLNPQLLNKPLEVEDFCVMDVIPVVPEVTHNHLYCPSNGKFRMPCPDCGSHETTMDGWCSKGPRRVIGLHGVQLMICKQYKCKNAKCKRCGDVSECF